MIVRPLAALTLVGCTATLQYHSVLWWTGQVGPSGVAWSLVLELVAFWFWFHGTVARRVIGAAASVIVLIGPLHHVAGPLWQQTAAQTAERAELSARLDSLRSEIEAQRETLAGYRQRSQERVGWRDVQEAASQRLAKLRQKERDLLARRAELSGSGPVALELVTVLQLGALLLYQVGAITALTHLAGAIRERRHGDTSRDVTQHAEPEQDGVPDESLVTLQQRLSDYMERTGYNRTDLAERLGVHRQEIGRALGHKGLAISGKRTASATTWRAVEQHLTEVEG